jgi:hypothetical protein
VVGLCLHFEEDTNDFSQDCACWWSLLLCHPRCSLSRRRGEDPHPACVKYNRGLIGGFKQVSWPFPLALVPPLLDTPPKVGSNLVV